VLQDFQIVSYVMMTTTGIKLMRQDRREIVMEQFTLRVQIERTTIIISMVTTLTFFSIHQCTPLTWIANNTQKMVLRSASQAQARCRPSYEEGYQLIEEGCQAISPASQCRPGVQIYQMQITQWTKRQENLQGSDPTKKRGNSNK
jgi:hypothetical protein